MISIVVMVNCGHTMQQMGVRIMKLLSRRSLAACRCFFYTNKAWIIVTDLSEAFSIWEIAVHSDLNEAFSIWEIPVHSRGNKMFFFSVSILFKTSKQLLCYEFKAALNIKFKFQVASLLTSFYDCTKL